MHRISNSHPFLSVLQVCPPRGAGGESRRARVWCATPTATAGYCYLPRSTRTSQDHCKFPIHLFTCVFSLTQFFSVTFFFFLPCNQSCHTPFNFMTVIVYRSYGNRIIFRIRLPSLHSPLISVLEFRIILHFPY